MPSSRRERYRASSRRSKRGRTGSSSRRFEAGQAGASSRRSRRASVRRRSPSRRWLERWPLLVSIVLGALAATVLASGALLRCFAVRPGPALPASVSVGWPDQLTAAEAAELLADLGLSSSRAALELYFRSSDASSCFRPGPHLLPGQASPQLLRKLLCRTTDRPRVRVTIPEGFTRFAVAERFQRRGVCARDAFLHATTDERLLHSLGVEAVDVAGADTAEGYLFPATYELHLDSDPRGVLRRLVTEMDRRWQRVLEAHPGTMARLEEELGWGRHEVLTLASMVEREARAAEERRLVASVFFNRLRDPEFRPKLLQSDPTAVYGCLVMRERIGACAGFDGKATPAINTDPANRYSTYVHEGLPPGPIANPGAASIEAVLDPAETGYLFFVAIGDGTHHVFSEEYEGHRRAVDRLRQRQER